MTLRNKVEKAIAEALAATPSDTKAAAIAACKIMEDEIGLDGNGWWDDDPEFQALLRSN